MFNFETEKPDGGTEKKPEQTDPIVKEPEPAVTEQEPAVKEKDPDDWYSIIEQQFKQSEPHYDEKQAERLRRLSKNDAFGKGFMAIGDMVGAAFNGTVSERPKTEIQPFVFKSLNDLDTNYATKKETYASNLASFRMKKAGMDDANSKWQAQLDFQAQKQGDVNEYNRARVEFQKAQEEQKKAWQEYLKTKDAKLLNVAWARINTSQEALKIAKEKLRLDPNYAASLEPDAYIGYDPLDLPGDMPKFANDQQEYGWKLAWLKGKGMTNTQFQTEAMQMLTREYNVPASDAGAIVLKFIK